MLAAGHPVGELAVLAYGERCGTLARSQGFAYTFSYAPHWIAARRPAISLALPPQSEPFSDELTRAYFGGLLPEGRARVHVAQQLQTDELDDFELLAQLGHECAGAIQVIPTEQLTAQGEPGSNTGSNTGSVQWLSHDDLQELIASMRVPAQAGTTAKYNISLAGAQLKRGVVVAGGNMGQVGLPVGDELSTHILKLAVDDYAGIVENEHCMQQLAADVGLRASATAIRDTGTERVLQVARYDRTSSTLHDPERLHQEDMCQALGRLSSSKYERYEPATGAARGPTIVDMITLIRRTAAPSIAQVNDLLRLVWFNTIIGNVDAHAKNYSILYNRPLTSYSIAPLYDAICVSAYHAHNSQAKRLSEEPVVMNIGGQTHFWQITRSDVAAHARSLSIQPTFVIAQIQRLLRDIASTIDARIDTAQASPETAHEILETVRSEIQARCQFLVQQLAG